MKIATWNINGIKARLDVALTWMKEANPDIVCLQEIKSTTEAFPGAAFEELGYNAAVHGQKGFNGVAILSKRPFDEIAVRGLPGDDSDSHARYIEVCVPRQGGVVRIGNLYLPNGNPVGTDKFAYKLAWMQRFAARTRELLGYEEPFFLLGDYNVIPEPIDAKNPEAWTSDALYQPETRAAYRALLNLGLTDVVRACLPGPGFYTFWPPRKRPIGFSPPASTSIRAAGRSPLTMCRCGSRRSWISPTRSWRVAYARGQRWDGSSARLLS
jgi:exodeoxyribonuclease-3